MNWWKAVVMGLTQGLTEFLPVSSSGHLVLMQRLLGISEQDAMFFFVMLHFGTLIAVVVALRKPIGSLLKFPIKRQVWYLLIVTVPAGLVGVLLNDPIEKLFGGDWLWLSFLVTAVLLLVTEIICRVRARREIVAVHEKPTNDYAPNVTLRQALVMGLAQAVAIVPGISRSGSTICGGLLSGGEKRSVADFSFLMSIPIILASTLLEVFQLESLVGVDWLCVAIGVAASFVSGLLAIKLMLALIKRINYKYFSLYLIVLAVALLVLKCTGTWMV